MAYLQKKSRFTKKRKTLRLRKMRKYTKKTRVSRKRLNKKRGGEQISDIENQIQDESFSEPDLTKIYPPPPAIDKPIHQIWNIPEQNPEKYEKQFDIEAPPISSPEVNISEDYGQYVEFTGGKKKTRKNQSKHKQNPPKMFIERVGIPGRGDTYL